MVSSVSSNVQAAWANRDALGIDQSKDTVEQVFPEKTESGDKVDVTGLTKEGVEAEIAALEKSTEELKASKEENDKKISTLQKEAADLKKQINELIDQALDESDKYTKEQREEIKKATDAVIEEYMNSNGTMTEEEMQAKLAEKLGSIDCNLPAKIAGLLTEAKSLMDQLSAKMQLIATLTTISECFGRQIEANECKKGNLEVKQEELKKQEEEKKKCDPIGFVLDGKICDFIIDRNGDNKFNNESEFLGAQNNWNEMVALDEKGNGDGKVSAEEMENANVKVLVTNADGSQEIVNVKDLGIDEIDLSSYKSSNDKMASGNEVLGTFGITINGKTLGDGYNTLDTVDWLDKNYSNMFTDKAERKGRFATEDGLSKPQGENKFNIGQSILELFDLRKRLTDAEKSINKDFTNLQEYKAESANTTATAPEKEEDPEKKPEKEPVV